MSVVSIILMDSMSEEHLKRLQSFLRSAITDAEMEEDWREGDSDKTLPLLRGLLTHLSIEFLGEEPDVNNEYDDPDDDDLF